jgi:hypothetical protein
LIGRPKVVNELHGGGNTKGNRCELAKAFLLPEAKEFNSKFPDVFQQFGVRVGVARKEAVDAGKQAIDSVLSHCSSWLI